MHWEAYIFQNYKGSIIPQNVYQNVMYDDNHMKARLTITAKMSYDGGKVACSPLFNLLGKAKSNCCVFCKKENVH